MFTKFDIQISKNIAISSISYSQKLFHSSITMTDIPEKI